MPAIAQMFTNAWTLPRQYGLESDKVLDSIIVSRPFTIHQLARLIVHSLQSAMHDYSTKLVVVSDVLSMFIKADPQIDLDEARWLIKEISRALKKLSAQAMIVISMQQPTPPPRRGMPALYGIYSIIISRSLLMLILSIAYNCR